MVNSHKYIIKFNFLWFIYLYIIINIYNNNNNNNNRIIYIINIEWNGIHCLFNIKIHINI